MLTLLKFATLLCLSVVTFSCFSQNRTIDSLNSALKNAKQDTTRCAILNALLEEATSEEAWVNYTEQIRIITEKKLKEPSISAALAYTFKKHYTTALNNLGGGLYHQGKVSKSLECFNKSLKIQEESGDKDGMAFSFNNLGTIYLEQGDPAKALDYLKRALRLREGLGDKRLIALSLNNIGGSYLKQNNGSEALEYFQRSLKLLEELGDKRGIARAFNNIGNVYFDLKQIDKATEYFEKSLALQERLGDRRGMTFSLNNLGNIYSDQKKFAKALEAAKKSMELSRALGFPECIRSSAKTLFRVNKATANYKLALENYELYIQMRDSINNESTRKASIKNQLKYEYEKQAAADSVAHGKESEIKNVELKRQSAEIKAKKNQQYALFGGLFLVCFFGAFMFNRFKITQKQKIIIESQKEVVEEQKKLVEEKQKEVLDSIRYAKRIQIAHLPAEKYLEKTLARLRK